MLKKPSTPRKMSQALKEVPLGVLGVM